MVTFMERGTRNTEHGTLEIERGARKACVPRSQDATPSKKGFTLIELIVVVTIVGILASVALVNVRYAQRKAREAVLKDSLHNIRKAIDTYYGDKQKYPSNLEDLVPNYLRSLPADPITGEADWQIEMDEGPITEEGEFMGETDPEAFTEPGIINVRSAAEGETLDGTPYEDL
jgi:general secretion pathway protein G